MNSQYITPLLEATISVLSTMAMIDVTPGEPSIKTNTTNLGDITSTIALAGQKQQGSLAISFSKQAILTITKNMLGETLEHIDETVADVVGEITNMITGSAKRIYSEQGMEFDLTRPTTTIGSDHPITHTVTGTTIVLPFNTNSDAFYIEFCFS